VLGYFHRASLSINVSGFAFNMFSRRVGGRLCSLSHGDVTASAKDRSMPLANARKLNGTPYFMPWDRKPKRATPVRSIRRSILLGLALFPRREFPPWRLRNHRFDEFCATNSGIIFRSGEFSAILVALATSLRNMVAKATIFSRAHKSPKTLFPPALSHGIPWP
jgi:hypothetical protein